MTGAINFLQHARDLCNNTMDGCHKCILHTNKPYGRCLIMSYFNTFYELTDEEIIDIVQDVEKWGKENGWWIENGE